MMKLTLQDAKYFKDSISIMSDLVTEARFKISKNGVESVAMDPANVAMVILKILPSAFVEYNIKEAEELCLNLANLRQVLKRSKPDDVLTLEIDEGKLKITLKSKSTRTFYLPLLDTEEKEQRVPELKFATKVECPSNVLAESIEDADIVGESVSLIAEAKKFTIEAEGDLSKAKIEIKEDEGAKIVVGEKVKSKYSIEYLKKMINGGKLAENVTIRFDKDYPLQLDFKETDKISMSFILAPRVEND
ncbi:MAG: proliferating cell nuclear antigen (pcna) [Candidatus Pacearchaeota archaeon]